MASFQAKLVWKRQRKRENKNYSFVPSLPDAKFKIRKKFQKIKKCQYGFIYSQNRFCKGRERKKINIVVLLRSYPKRNRNFQKHSKKIKK